ncbi:uncharacterized protein LOC123871656 [Maniola jurtina]|uniref:uncharacterized protein LOC123871656 n=1 Tax=Maniola jurtina TaxID=191418 RepID=UPI001E687514|nr:uncharacterized protein LOC123871656 [Maniola jurtina]
MSGKSDLCKIWTRFESKKQDGSIIKLRIQSWPLQPEDDVYEFMIKYFVPDEAIHKAAGIAKSQEAIKEYRELMNILFKVAPLHATVCCFDTDTTTVEKILGASIVQLMKNTDKLEDITKHMVFKTAEMQELLHAAKVLEGYLEGKAGYETFYFGRGISVHPDYRRLGIANELIKVRKLICIDNNIPMACAGMSARGTQKAADKNNWKTLSEVSLEELQEKTGLKLEKNIISHKLMYTTID